MIISESGFKSFSLKARIYGKEEVYTAAAVLILEVMHLKLGKLVKKKKPKHSHLIYLPLGGRVTICKHNLNTSSPCSRGFKIRLWASHQKTLGKRHPPHLHEHFNFIAELCYVSYCYLTP